MHYTLTTMTPALEIIAYIGVVLTLILAGWVIVIELRLRKFLRGKNARSLEDTIAGLVQNGEAISQGIKGVGIRLEDMNTRLKKALRGSHVLRFNAFPDSGGNQSFAAALLNEDGDGIVLSSLYSRERTSIYAKPVKNLKSSYELSREEEGAITRASEKPPAN